MGDPHSIVIVLFGALLGAILTWWRLHHRLGPKPSRSGADYRLWQWLVALIATLLIGVVILIVLFSDPGGPDDHLLGP